MADFETILYKMQSIADCAMLAEKHSNTETYKQLEQDAKDVEQWIKDCYYYRQLCQHQLNTIAHIVIGEDNPLAKQIIEVLDSDEI